MRIDRSITIDDFDEATRKRFLIGMAWTCLTGNQLKQDLNLIGNLPFDEQHHYMRAVVRQKYDLINTKACQAWIAKHHAKINKLAKAQIERKEVRTP